MPYFLNKVNFDIEDFDDEIVLVNFQTGVYYTIKGSGPTILRTFQKGIDLTTLHENVLANSGPERQSEVQLFLDQLLSEGILVATDAETISPSNLNLLVLDEAPVFERFGDVSDLIKLDPIHDVSDLGWPHKK